MNDATPWIDPELVAAGKLLQSRASSRPTARGAADRGPRRDTTASARFSARAPCRSSMSGT